jgi:hypothetical protein
MTLLPFVRSSTFLPRPLRAAVVGAIGLAAMTLVVTPAGAVTHAGSFVGPGSTVSEIGATIPPNGDVNPYGVAVVAKSQGAEVAGDVLVSNFNSGPGAAGLQGRGTTIVELDPNAGSSASPQVFAQIDPNHLPGACPGGVGLTTALSILPGGWVVVGSLPTSDGSTITGAGCLLVLNSSGDVVETFSGGPINGPWDMTSISIGDFSELSFTNVLNGTVKAAGSVVNQGTVVRAVLFDPPLGRQGCWGRRSSLQDSPKSSILRHSSSVRPESLSTRAVPFTWPTP